MKRLALAAVSVIGCASGKSAVVESKYDGYDVAYLNARRASGSCPSEDAARCCPSLEAGLVQARKTEAQEDEAKLVDEVAISCPAAARAWAVSLLDHPTVRVVPNRREAPPQILVTYEAGNREDFRLYWAGAFVDGKYAVPATSIPAGRHRLDVEVHVISLAGTGENQLYAMRAHRDFTIADSQAANFMVTLWRTKHQDADRAFALGIISRLGRRLGPEAPEEPLPAGATKGSLKDGSTYRGPTELRRPYWWFGAFHVCVNDRGLVESAAPLRSLHPREIGEHLQWLRSAEYEPYRVDGEPRAFCFLMAVDHGPRGP